VRASTTAVGGGAVSGACASPTGLAAEERRLARAPGGGAVAGAVARASPTVSWRSEEVGRRTLAAMVEGAQGGAQA
jgi:hypothetical protein